MQDYQKLLLQIKDQKYAPFYLLSGLESYFIDQLVETLTEQLVDEQSAAFDHTILYGKECSVAQIIETAKRFPMVGTTQLVVVKEAQYLDKQLDDLADYVSQATPTTVLVLCWKNKTFDKRKKLYKATQKYGLFLDSKPLYDNQIGPWLSAQSKAMNLQLTPESNALLQEYLGSDLQRIEKALEKLKLVIKDGEPIVPSTIEYHIGISKAYNNFELQKAIGQRNFSQAIKICNYLAENQKQYPLVVTISSLFRYFERIMLFHALDNPQEAPKVLGVSHYFIKEYQQAARHFSMKKCSKALESVYEADLRSKGIKGNNHSSSAILKQLMLSLWT